MQSQRRNQPRVATEPKVPAGRREFDINRERLVFCLTSLVGHKVTAVLRNNVKYEGVFHSCALDGDFSITLKHARQLASENSNSGEMIRTLVIPSKDFLQVSAANIPPLSQEVQTSGRGGFATDAEITKKRGSDVEVREHDLVPWNGLDGAPVDGGLEELGHGHKREKPWDQFEKNEQMFGVVSTYHEDFYTTKLDPNSINPELRKQAERIAREIEGGPSHSEIEGVLEGAAEDEEAHFSAVSGGRTKGSKGDLAVGKGKDAKGKGRGSSSSSGGLSQLRELDSAIVPQVPLTREHLTQHDSLSRVPSPMISEMKRINALNLEPALPKLDDKTRNDWINFKQSQTRSSLKSTHGQDLKEEFRQSLEVIQKRTANKELAKRGEAPNDSNPSSSSGFGNGAQSAPSHGRRGESNALTPTGGDSSKSKFSFNPGAKEFSFNPGASAFTPTNAGSGGGGGAQVQTPTAASSGPQFMASRVNEALLNRSLALLLEGLHARAAKERVDAPGDWPDAKGPSFHEVLGQRAQGTNSAIQPGVQMVPPQMMQQGQMGQQGPGPPMMQQVQGYPGQMFQPNNQGGNRPNNQGGNMQNNQGQNMQMPQQQPQMGGNQQQMMQPPQNMMQPGNMGGQQGAQNQGGMAPMAPVPKFGAQMVPMMMPSGQFMQAFVPQQGMQQGQGNQQGPQGGGPQQGQMMQQQGQMMQGQMMQPYHQQMGRPGPPHQMQG